MHDVSASILAIAIAIATATSGCGKKEESGPAQAPAATEKLTIVAADVAPCINGLRPTKEPMAILRKGDLVYVRSESKGHLSWKQKVEGVEMTRDSDMVIISRAPGNEQLYTFTKDLGEIVEVPSAASICGEIDRAGIRLTHYVCTEALQRHRSSSGHTAGFIICNDGQCPIASIAGDKAHVITVDGMIDLRPIIVDGRTIFLAVRRFNRNAGTWTGGAIVPIDMSGAEPVVRAEIQLDEVDARDAAVVRTRSAQFEVKGNSVRVFGDRAETERETGKDKSRAPYEETHGLGK
jgi:hypothetical protein